MIRLATDENIDRDLVRGLIVRLPELDIVRIGEVGLLGAPDPEILAWCASEGRVLLTHDAKTMPAFAYARVDAGFPFPGVIIVRQSLPIGWVIEELTTLIGAGEPEDLTNLVYFLSS